MAGVNEIALPRNKSELNILRQMICKSAIGSKLRIYIGSCPDYSNDGQRYTHETLGDGVPLLTRHHLEVSTRLLNLFRKFGINSEMIIMVADVEATDQVFCDRFTDGKRDEFLARCKRSLEATRAILERSDILSSSFFVEFGYERFMETQGKYVLSLSQRYEADARFHYRVLSDTQARLSLYRKMYPFIFSQGVGVDKRKEFLVGRTIRTMAQYLSLGRLISEGSQQCLIINHPTINSGVFNDRGKYLLPEDDPRYPQPTIPIFIMTRKVY